MNKACDIAEMWFDALEDQAQKAMVTTLVQNAFARGNISGRLNALHECLKMFDWHTDSYKIEDLIESTEDSFINPNKQ